MTSGQMHCTAELSADLNLLCPAAIAKPARKTLSGFVACAGQVKDRLREGMAVQSRLKAFGNALYTVQSRMDRSQVVLLHTLCLCSACACAGAMKLAQIPAP